MNISLVALVLVMNDFYRASNSQHSMTHTGLKETVAGEVQLPLVANLFVTCANSLDGSETTGIALSCSAANGISSRFGNPMCKDYKSNSAHEPNLFTHKLTLSLQVIAVHSHSPMKK